MVEQIPPQDRSNKPSDALGPAELREELARSRKEVLRLRDLLIARDLELGVVRGRLSELEDRSARFLNIAARLQRLPRAVLRGRRTFRRAQD